jgi:dephospho-CoA kinase
MLRVGLTGGIGSGKSEVARLLREKGAVVIDSDRLARDVVQPGTEGFDRVVAEFGTDVVDASGHLDRPRLASIVFADAAAREKLNAIVHPLVRVAAESASRDAPQHAVVVQDVPLLVESGLVDQFDAVIVVATPPETQLHRLVTGRAMSEDDARARIAAQASLADKMAVADFVVDNTGTLEELSERVDSLWEQLLRMA